jgi:hypothetical protein
MTPNILPIIRGVSLAMLFLLPGAANAASLKLQSIEAFSRHLCQLAPEAELAAGAGSEFLWSTASAEIKRRIADHRN